MIRRAAAAIAEDPDDDLIEGLINTGGRLRLYKIRQSHWRGGLWEDPGTGVLWLVYAGLSKGGLAKGGHDDSGDIYRRIERMQTLDHLLPTDQDQLLLKRETAARMITEWELDIQKNIAQVLGDIAGGGSWRWNAPHFVPGHHSLATVSVSVEPHSGDTTADVFVEIAPNWKAEVSAEDIWELTLRVLITLSPPVQDWGTDGNSDFFTMVDHDSLISHSQELLEMCHRGELGSPQPGKNSHYAHKEHLADRSVDGQAVRALCGVFFVPFQDHHKLEVCPDCKTHYEKLPRQ